MQSGRLVLADGTKFDLERVWLTPEDAQAVAEVAVCIVQSSGLATADISSDKQAIRGLLARVDQPPRSVGARRYRAGDQVALVLHEFH